MNNLFDNQLSPITNSIGFLECSLEQAVAAYVSWQKPIQEKRDITLQVEQIDDKLRELLLRLLPLTSVERRRFIFVETNSPWVAYFDNGHQSSDASNVASYLAKKIGCMGVSASFVPDNAETQAMPARILELFGPHPTDFLNHIRSISLTKDGGRKWMFTASGYVQAFEHPECYSNRKVEDRFSPEMLKSYAEALGIRFFEEDFYRPNSALLVSKVGKSLSTSHEFGLSHL